MKAVLVLPALAFRGVRREARRSLLTASAMAVGLALLILSRSLADGAHEDWIDTGVRLAAGHVAVQAPGYLESSSLEDRLDADQLQTVDRALGRTHPDWVVEQTTTRLAVQGLASSAESALPVLIQRVDPSTEAGFSGLGENLVEGRYLGPEDRLAAFIGTRLQERLALGLGSRFVLTAQGTDGEIEGQLVRVTGVFRTGLEELDEGFIQIPLATAQSWLDAEGSATTVAVLLENSRQVDAAVGALRVDLGTAGLRVLPWQESSPKLDSAVRMDDYRDWIFHSILFLIVGIAILNAVLMSVLSRKRELGVMRALGLTGGETGVLVLLEGLLLTAIAGVMGMALGFGVTWLFFRDGLDLSGLLDSDLTFSGLVFDPVMVPRFRLVHVLQSLGFIAFIGITASLYPAYHASRMDPAEAIKWEG